MKSPLRRRNLRWRLLPLQIAFILVLVLGRPGLGWAVAGGVLIVLGEGLRLWGTGHLVKNRDLTTSGPYAYLRHPLYLGSLLVGGGLALAAGGRVGVAALSVLLPGFLLYYLPYKERIESARLERRYGEVYTAYHVAVPALVPAPRAWQAGHGEDGRRWSAARVAGNHESGIVVGLAAALSLVALRWLLPL